MNKRIMESRINRKGWGVYIDMNERYWSWESKATLIQVKGKVEKVKIGKRKKKRKKRKEKKKEKRSSREWFRSIDLWVMGPARSHCATLLVGGTRANEFIFICEYFVW